MMNVAVPPGPYRENVIRPSHVLLRSRRLVLAAAALATSLSLLAALTPETLLRVDLPLSDALRRDELTVWLRWVTHAGSPNTAAVLGVVAATLLWHRCRAFALALPITVAAGIGVDLGLKLLVDRPRPAMPLVGTAAGSFPSGHVIQAIIVFGLLVPALYLVTGRRATFRITTGLLVVMVAAVSLSRVVLGAHWPTDVVASVFVGAALLLGTEYLVGSRWARNACGACLLHRPDGRDVDLLPEGSTTP